MAVKRTFKLLLCFLLVAAGLALAQSANAQYQPVPDFTGTRAGFQFRGAMNQRFGGQVPISPDMVSMTFATLPTEQDGQLFWCRDCARTRPCSGSGSGAFAMGERGQWQCEAPGPLEQDLNGNYHNVTNLVGVKTQNSGDANPREAITTGTGYQVGNGTAAPVTAIDESGNVTAQNLTVKGASFKSNVITISSTPYTVAAGDLYDDCNATGGARTINLPAASGSGRELTFKKADSSANACTVTPNGTDKIDGASSKSLSSQYVGMTIRDEAPGVWDIVDPGGSGGSTVTGGSCAANQYADAIATTTGAPTCAQVAFSQLSGSAACAQLPALTGDLTSSAGSCATAFASPTAHPLIGASSSPTDAASLTLNWATGSGFFISILTASTTIAFSGAVANQRIIVELQQAASGGPYTVTWPVGVKWAGGTAPTMTTTASKKDIYSFLYDGTDYLGTATQNF